MNRRGIHTESARRIDEEPARSLQGSHLTSWAHHLDAPTLVDRLIALIAVGLIAVQPGGLALALPLLMAVIRPRVPYLVGAAAASFVWVLLLSPGSDVAIAGPGPSGLAVVVAAILAMAASAAAFARAVEHPRERAHEWWIPVAVLAAASAVTWFLVVTTMLRLGGGTFAPAVLQLAVRQTPGLVVWPVAMAATLAVQPRSVARWTVPAAATLVVLALWASTAGFQLLGRKADDLAIHGRTDSLKAAIEARVVFQEQYPAEPDFRPSVVRLAPVGRSHALGDLMTARRGAVYEWLVYPEGRPEPFTVEACDIAFVTADRVVALVPRLGEIGHVGFELVEVTREGRRPLGIELPLLERPTLAFDFATHRWWVHGTEPPLRGLFAGLLQDGFVLRLFDGNVRVRVTSQTVFEGFDRLDDLTSRDRIVVETVGPAAPDEAARVVRFDSFDTPDTVSEPSVFVRRTGRLGGPAGATTTRWTVAARGEVTWTPLDDHVALAQIMVVPGDDGSLDDPSRWADDGRHRPRFQLLEVTRHGRRTLAGFGQAVVCRAPSVSDGTALCTASDDRTVSVWRAAIGRDGVGLDPLLSLQTPFVSPAVVTREITVLTGPQVDPIAVNYASARAAPVAFAGPIVWQSITATGPRELATLIRTGDRVGVARLQLPGAW